MKLTPPAPDDVPVLERWLRDEPLLRLIRVEPPRPDMPVLTTIIRLDDGTPVGWIDLFNIDPENRKAEAGIAIPDPRGRGLAPLAGKKFLTLAFGVWGFNRVTCRVLASNTYAIRCAELFGLVREGVERQAVWRDDKFEDVVLFGMLKEDFGKKVMRRGRGSTIRPGRAWAGAARADVPGTANAADAREAPDPGLGRGDEAGDRDVDSDLRRADAEDA